MRIGVAGVGRIGARHAATLAAHPGVDTLVITDPVPGRAAAVAGPLGAAVAAGPQELLASGVDGFVVAAASDAHAGLVLAGLDAAVPVFCEKPVAPDTAGAVRLLAAVAAAGGTVQMGFQRRYDLGYTAARAAVADGSLGWVHTYRAATFDAAPPPPAYVPVSGGIFRDCSVHDFDIVRWVSGQEVESVFAVGANHGAQVFRDCGDVDAAAAILTLTDGSFVHVSASRYNGRGHDVRLEVLGSADSIAVGLDDHLPLRSVEAGVTFPAGPPATGFLDRFAAAYVAEMAAFVALVADGGPSPCTVADAVEATLIAEACEASRARREPVAMAEIRGAMAGSRLAAAAR